MRSRSPPLRAELLRIACAPGNLLLLALPAAASAARIGFQYRAARLAEARRAAGAATEAVVFEPTGFGPMADGIRAGSIVLTLVLLTLGALSLSRERESGALAMWFLARSRGAVVVAKALALALLSAVGFALLFATAFALARWLYGMGPIVEEGYEIATAAELWSEIRRGTLPALPGLIAVSWFGLFVSSLASSTGVSVAAALIPFTLLDVMKEFAGETSDLLFITYAPFLGDGSPLAKLPDMARFYADAVWDDAALQSAVVVPAGWALGFLVLSILSTRRRPA